MPRFTNEDKKDLSEVLKDAKDLLDEAFEFSDQNGPKGITRKIERAAIIIDDVIEKLRTTGF